MERVLTISRCPDRLTPFDSHTEVDFSKRGSFYVEPGGIASRRERDGVALPTGHVADRAEDQVALLTVVLDGALRLKFAVAKLVRTRGRYVGEHPGTHEYRPVR